MVPQFRKAFVFGEILFLFVNSASGDKYDDSHLFQNHGTH